MPIFIKESKNEHLLNQEITNLIKSGQKRVVDQPIKHGSSSKHLKAHPPYGRFKKWKSHRTPSNNISKIRFQSQRKPSLKFVIDDAFMPKA